MTPAAIIQQAESEGVILAVTSAGTVKASGDRAAVSQWLPMIRDNKPGIVAALREAAAEARCWRWLIHYPDREPVAVACCPSATHAEILTGRPDAIAVEPFEPIRRQPDAPLSTNDETTIRAWLAHIEETDPAIIADLLDKCRTDADTREYFIRRAGEEECQPYCRWV